MIVLNQNAPAEGVKFTITPNYGATAAATDVGRVHPSVTVAEGKHLATSYIPLVDDAVDEDDETFTVTVAANTDGWTLKDGGSDTLTVTIVDDDTAGVTVSAASPFTLSEGATATYTVVLNSQPTADVTITASSGDTGAASVSPASYTFTPAGWSTAQTFTVTGVTDTDTNDETVGVSHSVTSTDGKYTSALASTISVSVSDTTTADQQQQDPPANQAPTVANAIADATIVNASGTHQVSLSGTFSDADSDALTVTAASANTAKATVSVAADYSALTVTAKARGTATITVTADDGNGGTVSDTFTVTVKATPVVASAISDVSGLSEGATQDVSLSGVFSDADGDALTITAASSDTGKATVSVASDGSKLTLTGVAQGTATVTVTAQDSDGNRVSDAFSVTVAAPPQQAVELPGPVVSLELTASGENRVTVSWSAPATGGAPDGYIVHLKPENGKKGSGKTKRPKAKKTQVKFNNLQPGQTYQVWVRAQNEAGKGERVHASITLPE